MFDTAILLIVFNRPDLTTRVFKEIRKARPRNLYVAADGPRDERGGEHEKVSLVRKIVTDIDWDCEVKTLFRDRNLGCKMAVSSAISWFFEYEEEGIILEDDCVPAESFFHYCIELLDKYRDDKRIMSITGDNFYSEQFQTDYSYHFTRYPHVWGWASWRRAWKYYDRDLVSWPEVRKSGAFENISNDKKFLKYWENQFNLCYEGRIDTWDYQWIYSCWIQNGLTISPKVNLISNIGFGESATHTKSSVHNLSEMPVQEISLPLKHPGHIIRNTTADNDFEHVSLGLDKEEVKNIFLFRRFILHLKKHIFR